LPGSTSRYTAAGFSLSCVSSTSCIPRQAGEHLRSLPSVSPPHPITHACFATSMYMLGKHSAIEDHGRVIQVADFVGH
jgi:hypothetical protein